MNIHVECNLYKLICAFQYQHCFKPFVIGKSIMHLMLHEFVCAMNIMLKIQLKWIDFEEDAIVKNKQGQCLVIVLIHILRFSTFVFFMVFLCCFFTCGVQMIHVNINLVHP